MPHWKDELYEDFVPLLFGGIIPTIVTLCFTSAYIGATYFIAFAVGFGFGKSSGIEQERFRRKRDSD